MESQTAGPQYVLGRSEAESRRLIKQADFLRPSTEHIFRKAGIAPGMRVLDLGCGAGDVSFLAAELVGPSGWVVGIDVDPGVLAVARQRAREKGLTWTSFEEGALDGWATPETFDAVVGRFILVYQADPAATLARVWGLLRPGGLLVVQEPDFSGGVRTAPSVQLWQQATAWIRETFRRGGVHDDIGAKLYPLFRRAGLPGPTLRQHVSVAGGAAVRELCQHSADVVRSLLPRMEQFGIARADDVQVDTLADRLERETIAAESQVTYLPLIGAWATKPPSLERPEPES
jgi:SAM-dependent methyltransferase